LARLIAGLGALHDNDVFGIAIARSVVHDGRAKLQSIDLGVGVVSVCPTNDGTVTVADDGIKKS